MLVNILAIIGLTTLVQGSPQDTLGQVSFPNSGKAAAQAPFLQGVRLLHSFEYETAAEAFREAERLDPNFAMAYWGEAMTHFHLLWREEDPGAARAVLRTGADGAAHVPGPTTPRERLYLAAAAALTGPGPKPERLAAYAAAMKRLSEAYPKDLEARSLYALAILGTADGKRDIPTYMRAAAVAEEVFAVAPRHPGAAHYLIHAYDDPMHAPLGRRAARVYAEIAPGAPHALHMPSHIFLALGEWDAVVSANRASAEAATRKIAAGNGDGLGARNHALYWLTYGLVQQGDWDGAREVVDVLEREADTTQNDFTKWTAVMSRAVYLANGAPADAALIARACSPAGVGRQARAASRLAAELALGGRPCSAAGDAPGDADQNAVVRIVTLERRALALVAAGATDSAVTLLETAVDEDEAQPIDFGPPAAVKPPAEFLGEVLLRSGDAGAAAAAFRRGLARTPNRRLGIQGLAQAEKLAAAAAAAGRADRSAGGGA